MTAKIKVNVSKDRMGNITLRPISKAFIKKVVRAVVENGGPNDEDVFLQGDDVDYFLSELPRSAQRDLDEGWDVTVLMDPWDMAGYYGYDATQSLSGE